MSRGKRPELYPPQIRQLVEKLGDINLHPKRLEFLYPAKAAQRFRFQMYNYMNAVDRFANSADPATASRYSEQAHYVNTFRKTYKMCLMTLETDGKEGIAFVPRNEGDLESALDDFLSKIEQETQTEQIDLPPDVLEDIRRKTQQRPAASLEQLGYFSRTARGENYNPEDDK